MHVALYKEEKDLNEAGMPKDEGDFFSVAVETG